MHQEDAILNTEPTADERVTARTLWRLYVALLDAGFDNQQALVIIGNMIDSTRGSR